MGKISGLDVVIAMLVVERMKKKKGDRRKIGNFESAA
jgi:hypothetical protein